MKRRRGISLLEILLAIAILGGSLAVLSQIVGIGGDASRSAQELAMARMLCQSKLAEVMVKASSIMPTSVPPTSILSPDSASDTQFEYAVDVAQAGSNGLLAIRVSVQALGPGGEGPPLANYSITRWVIDPTLGLEQREADAAAAKAEEESSSATSSSSTSSSGGTP